MTSIIPGLASFSYSNSSIVAAAGKMYVPVSKSALLYSHFDHVSGVAAGNGQSGVSISKLRILNFKRSFSRSGRCTYSKLSKTAPAGTSNSIYPQRCTTTGRRSFYTSCINIQELCKKMNKSANY